MPRTRYLDSLPAPRTRARHAENLALAEKLRSQPGRWVRYPYSLDRPHDLRYRIASGKDAAFRPDFDAQVREDHVFITYLGKATS
jgi:hypothetical protein